MRSHQRRTSGRSLVELLVVLAIVGLMLGIFLPAVLSVYRAALRLGE